MNQSFQNDILQQALHGMREELNNESLLKASRALLDTQILMPATWDKEPSLQEDGQYSFDPDTKISLLVVNNTDKGLKFFPAFTSHEELKNFYGDKQVNCMILTINQYLPFLKQAEGDVEGIVVDPAGAGVPFDTKFIEGIVAARAKEAVPLNQNTIRKGERIFLRNPEGNIQDLEAALISAGFHEPSIKAIYLKERVENPENPENTHWFIVIDTDDLDTGLFTRIGANVHRAAKGKEMEFMFTNQKLGADIARTSKPLYTKAA